MADQKNPLARQHFDIPSGAPAAEQVVVLYAPRPEGVKGRPTRNRHGFDTRNHTDFLVQIGVGDGVASVAADVKAQVSLDGTNFLDLGVSTTTDPNGRALLSFKIPTGNAWVRIHFSEQTAEGAKLAVVAANTTRYSYG